MTKLTNEMIEAAISGFEAQKQHIDTQIAELRTMLSPSSHGSAPRTPGRKKRHIGAAGRKAIAEAQRKRWAAAREGVTAKKAASPKRKLSAEGRAAIVAALKKRWADQKAGANPAKKKDARTKTK